MKEKRRERTNNLLLPCFTQRTRHKGRFEFTYVSKSSVIVKELKTGKRIVLRSMYQYEIERINIYKDRWDTQAEDYNLRHNTSFHKRGIKMMELICAIDAV